MRNLYYEYLERECNPDFIHLHIAKKEVNEIIDSLNYERRQLINSRGHDYSGVIVLSRIIKLFEEVL